MLKGFDELVAALDTGKPLKKGKKAVKKAKETKLKKSKKEALPIGQVERTVMIWDTFGQDPLVFVVFKGDKTKFDKVFINDSNASPKIQDKLSALMYDEDGAYKVKLLKKFPVKVIKEHENVAVIHAGFLP